MQYKAKLGQDMDQMSVKKYQQKHWISHLNVFKANNTNQKGRSHQTPTVSGRYLSSVFKSFFSLSSLITPI